MRFNFRDRRVIDEWTDARGFMRWVTDSERAHAHFKFGEELFSDALLEQKAIRTDACLTHEAKLREHGLRDGSIEIGIGKHEKRCVSAEFKRGAHEARRALRCEDATNFGRASEGEFARLWVIDEGVRDG